MTAPWPLFEVKVDGFETSTVAARSRGAALYSRYLDFADAFDCTFRAWLGMATARRVPTAAGPDPYDYVRRNYGRDLRHGTRVTIQHEGPGLDGSTGTVVHPGRESTAYAHVVIDGTRHAIIVHPRSVVIVSQLTDPAPPASSDEIPF